MKCGMANLGCPRPDEPADPEHLTADYEVHSEYHAECHDDPDCTFVEDHAPLNRTSKRDPRRAPREGSP